MGQDTTTHVRAEPTLPSGAPRALLSAPADHPTARTETAHPVTLIGSRRDCDLFISHGDLSKVHCALVNTGTAIVVADLCSRSGTFVNGQPVSVAALHAGDQLCVGSVTVDVQLLDVPDGSAAGAASENDAGTALAAPLRLIGADGQRELTTLPAVVGRRHTCQIVLDTPDVSLAHALLFAIEGCPTVFDLGSRSGTYLNGERVALAWLNDGDLLSIGGEELTVAWEGPQFVQSEATDAPATAEVNQAVAPPDVSGLADLEGMIADLRTQVSGCQDRLRERAALLGQREAELEARENGLEQERARLASEKQQLEQQTAELQAGLSELDQNRFQIHTQRARLDEERSQLDAQRAELDRRATECDSTLTTLGERERNLDERQTALEAAERELADRQADLAKTEAANAETAQMIEQFKTALNEARSVLTSVETPTQ